MPREIVTKGSRFYCVSQTPDICKTPIGSATPPIPYMIKGEFAEATGISKNIRSNGEQVVISDSTVIPKVTGDEAGTAKGIKSGTVGKRVQHDQKSSTVSFNGERAIREGDTVFMNDKNTKGKVLQRGGSATSTAQTVKKQIDIALDTAEKSIHAAQELAAGVYKQVESATQIQAVREMKDQLQNGLGTWEKMMRPALVLPGMSEAVRIQKEMAGAAIEFIPDNVLDLIPAKKVAQAGKVITKSVGASRNIEKVQRVGAKSANVSPPLKGSDGGKSRGKGKKEKNDKPSDCCPKNAGPGGKRTSSKHPVHFGTGEEVLRQTDFALAGAIPIVWTRCYRSGSETQDWSILGARWACPFTAYLSISRKGIVYHDDTGRALCLPSIEPGDEFDHRGEGFVLSRRDAGHFTLTWRDGSRDHFEQAGMGWLPHGYQGVNAMLLPQPAEMCERYLLCRSEDVAGRGLSIERFDAPSAPVLMRIVTDDGRIVEAMRKSHGRNAEVDLVSQVDEVRANGQRICHVKYEHAADHADAMFQPARRHDLVSQTDRTGATRHYRYAMHLLTAYTTYGGFEHRLEWISLAALRERWSGSQLSDHALIERHPITTDNSYQARATATRTADGRDEVEIEYLDEDTTRVTEPSGSVFDYTFDESWLAVDIAMVMRAGASRSLGRRTWSDDGMLLEETDALFRTWRYQYDSAGNLVTNTDAEGCTTKLEYDAQNRVVGITDALGNSTTYEYDEFGNLVSVTNALGHTSRFEYDKAGRICVQVDAKGNRTLYGYDTAGRLTSNTDCSGYRSYYRYDADDNLIATLDALEQETSYTYDDSGQVTTITHPDGTQEHYAYDADGNAIRHTDALGYQTHYRYDGHGMPIEQINALGHSVQYRYDTALRLVELINGNGESYRFSYAPEGWLASETTYDGKTTEYRYDRAGQLIAYESCGIEITMERDRMGRLILKTTPDGLTQYQYDVLGRLTAVAAPYAENGFVYDSVGQLLEEHSAYFISEPIPHAYKLRRVPDHYFVMRYAYDELGNRIQTILPDGHRIDVLRYGSGHWHGVLWDGEPVVDVERDRLHRELRRQIGPKSMKLVETRSYDVMSQVLAMVTDREQRDATTFPIRQRKFDYDAVGNLIRTKHGWDGRGHGQTDQHHGYDATGQLIRSYQTGRTEDRKFDANGNVCAMRSTLNTIKNADYIAHLNTSGYIYSKTSLRRSSLHELALSYNTDGTLIHAKNIKTYKTINANYYYDGFARRICKKIQNTSAVNNEDSLNTTFFLWQGDVLIQDRTLGKKRTYISEPDDFIPAALVTTNVNGSSNVYYYQCNLAGSATELIDAKGSIVWAATYNMQGGIIDVQSVQNEELQQPLRLLGQYYDDETSLSYNRYRYYDPTLARYTTPDPIGLLGGLNLYAYVGNSLQWADPLGLAKCRVRPSTAADEILALPQLCQQRPCDIRKALKRRGYTMVGSNKNPDGHNNGGQVWTKAMPDGHTAAVRIDPAEIRGEKKLAKMMGQSGERPADSLPHAHKEIVPSTNVQSGNYGPPKISGSVACTDAGTVASKNDHKGKHIPIRKGRLKDNIHVDD